MKKVFLFSLLALTLLGAGCTSLTQTLVFGDQLADPGYRTKGIVPNEDGSMAVLLQGLPEDRATILQVVEWDGREWKKLEGEKLEEKKNGPEGYFSYYSNVGWIDSLSFAYDLVMTDAHGEHYDSFVKVIGKEPYADMGSPGL